jgi:hypothetical protein
MYSKPHQVVLKILVMVLEFQEVKDLLQVANNLLQD